MEVRQFTVADMVFELHSPYPIEITQNFEPFAGERAPEKTIIDIYETGNLPAMPPELLYERPDMRVYGGNDSGFFREYMEIGNRGMPYAASHTDGDGLREQIWVLAGRDDRFRNSQECFAHIAFEELLLYRHRWMLHSALVDTRYGGLLFSGPSGIGKSTQAELWRLYEGGQILNGDRTILRKRESVWKGYGSPYAGSSMYYRNQSCTIRAVFLLEQGDQCEIEPMRGLGAFRRLLQETTVNTWNRWYTDEICTLINQFMEEVPIYRLKCTPDVQAVETVIKELNKKTFF